MPSHLPKKNSLISLQHYQYTSKLSISDQDIHEKSSQLYTDII